MQETYLVETQVELIVENKKLSILKKIGHNPHIFRQWVTKVLKMFEPLFQILYKFEKYNHTQYRINLNVYL